MAKERKRLAIGGLWPVLGGRCGGVVSWDNVVLIWNPAWSGLVLCHRPVHPFLLPPTSRLPPQSSQLTSLPGPDRGHLQGTHHLILWGTDSPGPSEPSGDSG